MQNKFPPISTSNLPNSLNPYIRIRFRFLEFYPPTQICSLLLPCFWFDTFPWLSSLLPSLPSLSQPQELAQPERNKGCFHFTRQKSNWQVRACASWFWARKSRQALRFFPVALFHMTLVNRTQLISDLGTLEQHLYTDTKGRGKIREQNRRSNCVSNKVLGPNFIFSCLLNRSSPSCLFCFLNEVSVLASIFQTCAV